MSEEQKTLNRAEKIRLRKNTVWAHWLVGLLCAIAAWQFFPAGLAFFLIFARWERWNDQNEKVRRPNYLPEGDLDTWDALVVKFSSFAIIVVLHAAKILTIRWY